MTDRRTTYALLLAASFGGCALEDDGAIAAPAAQVTQALSPPRPIAPLSTATVTSSRPTLKTTPRVRTRFQLCRDRACRDVVEDWTDDDGVARSPRALAPDVYFWRAARAPAAEQATGASEPPRWSVVWEFRAPKRAREAVADTSWGHFLDVNGDGYADAAITTGGPGEQGLDVFHGGPTGLATTPALSLRHPAGKPFLVSDVGDVDGNGFSDMLVQLDRTLRLYGGSPTGLVELPRPALETGWLLDTRPENVGDVDGDGYADVIVSQSNGLWVVHGAYSGIINLYGSYGTDRLKQARGTFVAASDFNGDGYGDIAFSEPEAEGASRRALRIAFGGARHTPPRQIFPLSARVEGESYAHDVEGDGYGDFVYGVEIFRGGPQAVRWEPHAPPIPGRPMDLTGDGHSDYVAAKRSQVQSVAIFGADAIAVYPSGVDGAVSHTEVQELTEVPYVGDQLNDFGVRGSADFDRDGRLDLLITAPAPYPSDNFNQRPSIALVLRGDVHGVEVAASPLLRGLPGFGTGALAGWSP